MVLVLFFCFLASTAALKPAPTVTGGSIRPVPASPPKPSKCDKEPIVPQQKCGINEYPVRCKTLCPPQSCDIAFTSYECPKKPKCIPGCDCIANHLRNSSGICILNDNCPGQPVAQPENPPQPAQDGQPSDQTSTVITGSQTSSQSESSAIASSSSSSSTSSSSSSSLSSSSTSSYKHGNKTVVPQQKCKVNEYPVKCKTLCPPQSCDIAFTSYECPKQQECIPGCDCIANHLRNSSGICILNDNCPGQPPAQPENPQENPPQPPQNEEPYDETSSETTGSQAFSQSESSASASSSSSSSTSSSSSASSSSSYSSSTTSTNGQGGGGLVRDCTYNKCTPTCSLPFPPNCPENSNPCKCSPGTIISGEGGKCVPLDECQKYTNCKGNYNETYSDCPIACPSTCAKPNAQFCDTKCGKLGCVCKSGYILSKKNGNCIKIEDCPGGSVCSKNETFVWCSVSCPNNFCPTDDSRAIIACDPPYPCPSGCSCNANYKIKSEDDRTCILASECPPVKCTRPNEVWNSCPKPCFSDLCSDRNQVTKPEDCPPYMAYCDPKCVCKQGFYRNGTDICVPPQECPADN